MHDGVATCELEALELEALEDGKSPVSTAENAGLSLVTYVLLDFGTSYPNLAEAVIVEVGDVEAKI